MSVTYSLNGAHPASIVARWAALVAVSLASQCAFAGEPPVHQGTTTEDRVALFADTGFRQGFHLAFPSSSRGHAVERVMPGAGGSAPPVWRLCQWATRLSLVGAPRLVLAGGAIEYEDATKRVVFGGGARGGVGDGPDLVLELRAGAEYEGRARAAGEPWPHLLVEQEAARAVTLDRLARLELDLDVRLASFADRMAGRADPGLHAAQLQLFLIIKDVSPDGRGDFLWFGVPLFDSRQDFPAPHRARDAGKDDASGKLIYSLDGRDVLPAPLRGGARVAIHKDLLPAIRDALRYGVGHGFLGSADPARFAAVNMNLGWEMPGAYDAAAEVRGLAVTAVLRAGAGEADPRPPAERPPEQR